VLSAFIAGFTLGFALIIPIGPQNLFVMDSGLRAGVRLVMWVVGVSALCDALLIIVGTVGIGSAMSRVPTARMVLLAAGIIFVAYVGAKALLSRAEHGRVALADVGTSLRQAARRAMAMSLFNPHAILDTVGTIGVAAAAQRATDRPLFAVGAITASIVWFTAIGLGSAALRNKLTPSVRRVIGRCSGIILVGFAGAFMVELVHLASKG